MKLPDLSKFSLRKPRHVLPSELFIYAPAAASGKLVTQDDITIDCVYNGQVDCVGHLTIGPDATVNGNARARSVRLQGSLEGSLEATETIVVQSNASLLNAKVVASKLEVQLGVRLNNVNITTT